MITAWVTKYALTKGILEVEGRISEVSPDMFVYGKNEHGRALKNEWFLTKIEAVERADEMRMDRIKSLIKSLAKMENFEIKIKKVK